MQAGDRIGQYEIQGSLGRGGMAEVFKAWHTHLHCFHALKIPLSQGQLGVDHELMRRFLREARTSANLHHANIATIHGVSDVGATQPYFVMEYIEGEDLSFLLARRGKLSLEEALPIIRQIAEALDYAHNRVYLDDEGNEKKGIVHRDIKPSNILLEDDGKGGWKVKVVDFGIAKAQEDTSGTRLTKSGMIVGTPEYMSPEQAQTPDLVNKRSDIYSFGILVYEMLTGKPPFKSQQDTSPISVLLKHVQEEPAPPIQAAPNLSSKANKAILKVLSKHPLERFDSCAAFVDALAPKVEVRRNWLPIAISGVGLTAALMAYIVWPHHEPPQLTPCDAESQCNIAACATSAFCQEIKRENESMANANSAMNLIDTASARREQLINEVKIGKITGVTAIQENDTKLIPKFKQAAKKAYHGIELNGQNDVAWLQYCRAGYYLAIKKSDFENTMKKIHQAEKACPQSTKFLLLKQLVIKDGKL